MEGAYPLTDTDEDSNGYLILAENACFNHLFLLLSIVEVLLISSLPFLVSATLGMNHHLTEMEQRKYL